MTTTSTAPLTGRVALVTGAASGIGAATARRLAADGACVALVARRADRLAALASEIGEQALAVPADLTRPDSIDRIAEDVTARLGAVDLLVNNAGVMLPNPIADRRGTEWQHMLDLNLIALLHVTRALLPGLLVAATEGRTADIVNLSSTGADAAVPAFAVYGATKAAVSYLSRALRAELAPTGVRITDVKPGGVATELFDHATHPDLREGMMTAARNGRLLNADDVADAICYAVSRPAHVCLSQLTVMPLAQPQ
ncbi:SDR family oxidoreductase [Actinophytocola oryzae]|nr:SDR family oxidoreductase [Actinophytocola oryzae]